MSFSIDRIVRRVGFTALVYIGLAMAQSTTADSLRIVELNDGSRIAGEILSFEAGVYTIQSDTLGRLDIPDESIRAIRSDRSKAAPTGESLVPLSSPLSGAQLRELQSNILSDPNILTVVMSLQNDPQLLSILNDPVIMRAIAAGDLESLQSSPKILELESHPTIQQLFQLIGTR